SGKRICIIGTGKMATALLNYLAGSGVEVTVAGRSLDHARNLAIKYGAAYSGLSDIDNIIKSNQIIIAATSSKQYVINNSNYSGVDSDKILIDLSNPPNIEKTQNPFIKLYDLERIYNISKDTRKHRELEVKKAEEIVENQLSLYASKINEMKSDEIISTFYKFAEQIKKEEIEELLRKTDVSERQLETINIMMNSFTNKLLAPYTNSMKNFIKNNEKYSYILQEYDNMLGKLLDKEKNIGVKNYK
ncbi:NAD(P)-binding domain-containing protein, partial [Ferroplasma sp.]|uniref:NAD(P)-binding domain-containing protein n=1 Tax=Ferroplasma sp. TaxID=2591003 RepID=UPI00262B3889